MKSGELRRKYLKFFEERGHRIIPSASLVPSESVELAGTQRVLFTTAGMHPLVPFLLGQPHPEGKRLVNVQRCLRTDDIDDVGDSVHNTFFEMLGNWSLGDYWKEEAIFWSWEFLTKELKLDSKRIYVSVFAGDEDAPFDEESYKIWKKLGVSEDHIFRYGKNQNWWGPVGPVGPCGPDTEMFYDLAPEEKGKIDPAANPNRFVEIWNDVFMEYEKRVKGEQEFEFVPLKQKNVDTGMGLERMLMVLQKAPSIYETDVFLELIKKIEDLSGNFQDHSARIVADHIRSSVFLAADGVTPANVERGYILRRLIRRAIRHANRLKIDADFMKDLAKITVKTYGNFYPYLVEFQNSIFEELKQEEAKFKKALKAGIRQFEKIKGEVSAKVAFDLYQNYGFPIELTSELAKENDQKVDIRGFEKELKEHQELSKSAGTKTRGGLAVQSQQAAKLHTATHLLHQALRDVLGKHVKQTGSHITEERLRFDFTHQQKLTEHQIRQVKELVQQKIKEDLIVKSETMPKKAADAIGAIGLFTEKYQDLVNIYFMSKTGKIDDAFSKEFCGGPHAQSTGTLGQFKIIKEESAGANIRRIYATIG